jgi:hypothetical protein
MKKIKFIKAKTSRKKQSVNPFAYGTHEYWQRRENIEILLDYDPYIINFNHDHDLIDNYYLGVLVRAFSEGIFILFLIV